MCMKGWVGNREEVSPCQYFPHQLINFKQPIILLTYFNYKSYFVFVNGLLV